MTTSPSFDSFRLNYEAGKAQVLWTTLVADLETPVSAYLKLSAGRRFSFLMESVEGGAVRGRYSFVGLNPDLIWRCHGERAEINRTALTAPDDAAAFEPCPLAPLQSLRAILRESEIDLPAELPPMAAGLVGYMGYDMVRQMERLDAPNPEVIAVPDGLFVRPTVMAVFDSVLDIMTVITPVRPEAGVTARAAYARAEERLNEVIDVFEGATPKQAAVPGNMAPIGEPHSNMSEDDYCRMVKRAKEYIGSGDIFQVVLSQRFEAPFTLPPIMLYRALRRTNPSPFLVFLDFGDFSVISSSPEILVRLRGGEVTIRPIAGTRRRGKDAAEDQLLSAELLADPKELAEHLMLLDLGRNDAGRVAQVGSVTVSEKMTIELYSHVMHIVSNVVGKIDPRYDAIDALSAGFPAGTVSGAPKVRAMQIIDELEPEKRGIYGGALGYFSASGNMDTCIALRTAIVKDGRMYVQAGAGIVADSVPLSEYEECRAKARALFRAADEALRFAAIAERGQ
jgi:anthranilate synthase component 1